MFYYQYSRRGVVGEGGFVIVDQRLSEIDDDPYNRSTQAIVWRI